MFLGAIARPRFDAYGNEEFFGKIGIFPFTFKEPAKRKSKNKGAGTLETKAIVAVTKDAIRSCLIENFLPAIRSKWPSSSATDPIYIQKDNARTHVHPLDADFIEAASKDGFNICLSFQPVQSPDMNVLDLGYFRVIQSLQHQQAPKTIDELDHVVEKSFEDLSSDCLNRVSLSLQACMIEVMKVNGGNNYKLPHIGKSRLLRDGFVLPAHPCEHQILDNAMLHLQE
ncbi:hypothetical protein Vadar_024892 [Vaccinium darrowii]|uniref:Uncharacterized protein n=1 Tax=Vaccinium darrowii TaxID=229202 RepID=A0ACB7ZM79_9ERIC|nr:hypothetical protein Vadar_024892 [Vaccinium darrowii]